MKKLSKKIALLSLCAFAITYTSSSFAQDNEQAIKDIMPQILQQAKTLVNLSVLGS